MSDWEQRYQFTVCRYQALVDRGAEKLYYIFHDGYVVGSAWTDRNPQLLSLFPTLPDETGESITYEATISAHYRPDAIVILVDCCDPPYQRLIELAEETSIQPEDFPYWVVTAPNVAGDWSDYVCSPVCWEDWPIQDGQLARYYVTLKRLT